MLNPLTAFRFFAALAVFLSHLSFFQDVPSLKPLYVGGLQEGYIGVTFFFILSGFILTYNYLAGFQVLRKAEIVRFYVARFARIYPVHLLTFILSLPLIFKVMRGHLIDTAVHAALNLSLLHGMVNRENVYFSFNLPSWSLSDEAFFYIVFPFLIWGAGRVRLLKNLTGTLGVGVATWLLTLVFAYRFRDHPAHHWLLYIFPPVRLADFWLGIVLGHAFSAFRHRLDKTPERVFTVLELLTLLAFGIAFGFSPHVPPALRYSAYYMPVFAAIIFVYAFQRGTASRWLSSPVLLLLGEASFSFYMIHQLVIRFLYHRLLDRPLLFAGAALAIALCLSILIYQYFEVPARRWVRSCFATENASRERVVPTAEGMSRLP